jgi:hypothetical protein
MVASHGDCDAAEFFRWSIRQMIFTRVYSPMLWWVGLVAQLVSCGGMAVAIVALALLSEWPWAAGLLALTTLPNMWRSTVRVRAAALVLPRQAAWLEGHKWTYFWLTLPATWVWLLVLLASARSRRVVWRGNVYELLGPGKTRVIAASD